MLFTSITTRKFFFKVTFIIKSRIKIANNKSIEFIKEYLFIVWNVIINSGVYCQYSGYLDINFSIDKDFTYELYPANITEGFCEEDKYLT